MDTAPLLDPLHNAHSGQQPPRVCACGKTDSYTHSTIDEINTDVTELIAKHSYIMIGLYFVSVLFN